MTDGTENARALQQQFESALNALQRGALDSAEAGFREIADRLPGHAGAFNGLGLVAVQRGDAEAARRHWEAAVQADPRFAAPHANLGNLKRQSDPVSAVAHYQQAMTCDPGDPQAAFGLATLLHGLDRTRDAAALAEEALKRFEGHAGFLCIAARGLMDEGRARDAWDRLSPIDPSRFPARIAQMVHYTRAAVADRLDDPAAALAAAREGAAVLRRLYPQAISQAPMVNADFGSIAAHYRASDLPSDPQGAGADLVFLIGFPGSGEGRLGKILARHPKIAYRAGRGALTNTQALAFGSPAIPRTLTAEERKDLQARYDRGFGADRVPGQIRVDHQPLNILTAGFAADLFPAARFIVTERDPLAACLSSCLRDYDLTPATSNLLSFSDAVDFFLRVRDSWNGVADALEPRTLRIAYERMERAPRETLEQVLAFLDIGGTVAPDAVTALETPSGPPVGSATRYEPHLPEAALTRLRTSDPAP